MKNEIVVQITATQNDVYGLTETGKLVRLDTNINKFVVKCSEEILTADKASTLTVFSPHVTPGGKYGKKADLPSEIEKPFWWKNKEAIIVALVALVPSILLAWFLLSH